MHDSNPSIRVRLIKPLKGKIVQYDAQIISRDETQILVRAPWATGYVDCGLICFRPGDWLDEYFYSDRWYNVFRIHAPDGALQGWYCNITRPALISAATIESEDLELDLLVSADRSRIRLDDEDEFAARRLHEHDQAAYTAALAAVDELRALIAQAAPPFDRQPG